MTELAVPREENADLRQQFKRHSCNSGQPPSQDGPSASPRPRFGAQAGVLPGLRMEGATVWLHVICDERTTLHRLGPRGAVWTEYGGTVVHGHLAC